MIYDGGADRDRTDDLLNAIPVKGSWSPGLTLGDSWRLRALEGTDLQMLQGIGIHPPGMPWESLGDRRTPMGTLQVDDIVGADWR